MKKLRITVEGKVYEVTVEVLEESGAGGAKPTPVSRPLTSSIAAPVASAKGAGPVAAGDGVVPSPLSGKVVAVAGSPGKRVGKGEEVVTIEAMKMNTFVYAPMDGVIEEVYVASGDAVEEGQGLFKMKAG
ncbi:MAG: biotin/lipoyl-containing protein [Verrucomicrobiia bacterium]